jgi:hypothetical protein
LLRRGPVNQAIQDDAVPLKGHHEHKFPQRVPNDGIVFEWRDNSRVPFQEQHWNHAGCSDDAAEGFERAFDEEFGGGQEYRVPSETAVDIQCGKWWQSVAVDLSNLGRLWTLVILIVTFLVAIDRLIDKLIRKL